MDRTEGARGAIREAATEFPWFNTRFGHGLVNVNSIGPSAGADYIWGRNISTISAPESLTEYAPPPLHFVLQVPPSFTPALMDESQKHWFCTERCLSAIDWLRNGPTLNSTPAKSYPAAKQVAWQLAALLLAMPPIWTALRVRAETLSV